MKRQIAVCLCLLTVVSAACAGAPGPQGSRGKAQFVPPTGVATAKVERAALATPVTCSSQFVAHPLDHVTTAGETPARQFDSNGSGVAADDLDGDGRADIVLGGLEDSGTILWNEGNWNFTKAEMKDFSIREVNLVDVDADGLLDIATTHRGAGLAVWRNLGGRKFSAMPMPLPDISEYAYSMAWADIDNDGDLDLATATYDAELDQRLRTTFLSGSGGGVYVYTNNGDGRYTRSRIAKKSQGLATSFIDLNLDGRPELLIGNDFAQEDMTYRRIANGTWELYKPFRFTSAHTMSIEPGDVDNDGVEEIFTSDMRAFSSDAKVIAAWMPLMATMDKLDRPAGPQRIRNVLEVNRGDGTFAERADQANVDVAGWAWSARFGDLDNDGHQDLYVVNGMIAAEALHYLPGAEIVEPNVFFRNKGDGTFVIDNSVGLDSTAGGRGSVEVDLDNDGRLDVVVNNMSSTSVAYENQLCGNGGAVEVRVQQPGLNPRAIGATVMLMTSDGEKLTRSVRSNGGYLSGNATTLHFGIGKGKVITSGEIRWPDGTATILDGVASGSLLTVTRT